MMRRFFNINFPNQFWLLFVGMLISTIGASMIWPFLMIFASERLQMPLTVAAGLLTLNSVCGLISSFIAGPLIDRFGRKWIMVASLLVNGLGYLLLSQEDSLPVFALIMAIQGAANPLYRVGADAMMADLVMPEKRADGYSLMRLSNNLGVAIGPAVGGFIAATSYSLTFYFAAAGLAIYSLMIAFLARETLPIQEKARKSSLLQPVGERFGGYGRVLNDRPYSTFILAFTFTQISAAIMWVLLSVYAKTNFGVSESQYGFIPMTNALMVVVLQIPVTLLVRRRTSLPIMAVGAFFYALGVGSVAFGQGFWGFWISMVIMTLGELILVPTSSTYAANLAPADMRGRYLSLYGLTWNVAAGIGPLTGGFLNDTLGPQAIWFGGGLTGVLSGLLFIVFHFRRSYQRPKQRSKPVAEFIEADR